MAQLKEFNKVRVRQILEHGAERYDAWGFNERPPKVGDTGYILDILQAQGLPDHYVVECSAPDGTTTWLGDFLEEELEYVNE